jgi:hypothetical protein
MQLHLLQHSIAQLAQQAVAEGLADNEHYEQQANAVISTWLAQNNFTVTEDNIYAVREDFDYYSNMHIA